MNFPLSRVHNGRRYFKGLITNCFVFYVNYQEIDDMVMYRLNGELVSDNYFAMQGFFEAVDEDIDDGSITHISKGCKPVIKQMRKDILEDRSFNPLNSNYVSD